MTKCHAIKGNRSRFITLTLTLEVTDHSRLSNSVADFSWLENAKTTKKTQNMTKCHAIKGNRSRFITLTLTLEVTDHSRLSNSVADFSWLDCSIFKTALPQFQSFSMLSTVIHSLSISQLQRN